MLARVAVASGVLREFISPISWSLRGLEVLAGKLQLRGQGACLTVVSRCYVREGRHGLLQRSAVVVPVGLIEVHVVGAQPAQRAMDRLGDVLAAQPVVVGSRTAGEVHL